VIKEIERRVSESAKAIYGKEMMDKSFTLPNRKEFVEEFFGKRKNPSQEIERRNNIRLPLNERMLKKDIRRR
jgi:hypothetical protein